MLELVHTSPWAWTILCLLVGLVAGGLYAGGWRIRLSNDLLGEQQRLRLIETKSEHQRFGISDLKLRIGLSQTENELLRTDLKLLRSTYARLDDELKTQWDSEVHLKSALVNQQADNDALETELTDWKARLTKLQDQLDEGAIDEAQLKRELTQGITAVCEHNSAEMTAVQTLLRDCAGQIDENTISQEPQKVIGLLAASVELLEGQMAYWQDLAVSHQKAELARLNEAAAETKDATAPNLSSIELSEVAQSDNPAANTENLTEAGNTDAENTAAENGTKAHGPKQSKRKRRSKRRSVRAQKTQGRAANDASEDTDGPNDPTAISQQA